MASILCSIFSGLDSGVKSVPARPRRSRARRISGAKMTGMAKSRAGRAVRISQEKAESSSKVVSKVIANTSTIMPLKSTTAWLPRTRLKSKKKMAATSKMSSRLSRLSR